LTYLSWIIAPSSGITGLSWRQTNSLLCFPKLGKHFKTRGSWPGTRWSGLSHKPVSFL
jgi:hypothetical protein